MTELYLPLDDYLSKTDNAESSRTAGTNDCPARNPFSLLIGGHCYTTPWPDTS